jgi:putative oxidoreductase
MRLNQFYREFSRLSEYTHSVTLLFARFAIAYGFYDPAMMKWNDIAAVGEWFGSMGIPLPHLSAYLVASLETAGVVLLILGLFTRFIAVALIVIMIVAIMTVHLHNGFSAANNGFEIPLYFMLFLFIFFSQGAGRFSLDRLFFERR